jgi:simple sugar transport system ATP-binding protein
VLRRGRVVFDGQAEGVSAEALSRHMVGRELSPVRLERGGGQPSNMGDKPVLSMQSITAGLLRDVALSIGHGEILGVAGVDGNGQQELAEVVVGLRAPSVGRVLLDGMDVTGQALAERARMGIAHVPNDRRREGLVGTMSVAENFALKRHAAAPFSHGGLVAWGKVRETARDLVARFDVRTSSIDTPVGTLSGGNQQKVILARELALSVPRLVVAMNPVRGLDVAAAHFVYEQLLAVRGRGGAVLLISSELDELLALCDRIGVLYGGRVTLSEFPREGAATEIGRMMTGAA